MQLIFNYFSINDLIVIQQYKDNNVPLDKYLITCSVCTDDENDADKEEEVYMLCDCTLTKEEIGRGVLGCGEDCINRHLMIECGSSCQLGTRCTNKRFQKRQYGKIEVFNTEKKGLGLRALQDMDPGDFIIEYVGEVIDPQEFHRRAKDYAREKNKHYYFMALKSDAIIDATQQGNVSRFINHSCDPNAVAQKWTVNGDLRVGLFARKSLKSGDEVTFDYHFQCYGKEAQRCYCEAANCRGWIIENSDRKIQQQQQQQQHSMAVSFNLNSNNNATTACATNPGTLMPPVATGGPAALVRALSQQQLSMPNQQQQQQQQLGGGFVTPIQVSRVRAPGELNGPTGPVFMLRGPGNAPNVQQQTAVVPPSRKRNNPGHGGSRRGSFSSEAETPVPDRQARGGTNSNITPALAAIKSGVMNALQASKEYNVPSSTLYYTLKKLNIATHPYDITPAIEAVNNGVMNVWQASIKYKVPKTTLYAKVKTKFRRMPSLSRVQPRSAQTM